MKSIHFDIVHIPIPRLLSQHLYRIEKVWFHIIPIETKSVLYRVHPMKLVRSNISIEWRISTSICWNIICYQNLIISIEYKYFVYLVDYQLHLNDIFRYLWKKIYYTNLQTVGNFYFTMINYLLVIKYLYLQVLMFLKKNSYIINK